MLIHQPPLADQTAALRTAILAEDAPCWLPDAVHALIMACLARIFGRLEDMIRLWQAGILPPRAHTASVIRAPRHAQLPTPQLSWPLDAPRPNSPNRPSAPANRDASPITGTTQVSLPARKSTPPLPCSFVPSCLCGRLLARLLACAPRPCTTAACPVRAPPPRNSAISGHEFRTP